MCGKIKRQCLYVALHNKISDRSRLLADAWTSAKMSGETCIYLARENVKLHRKLERIESKMWWITKKML